MGINVDHVATVRQARHATYPDPVAAAAIAELAGAAQITVHLREDRRHIQDADLPRLKEVVRTKFNLEMAATDEMVAIAIALRPELSMFVPVRRAEFPGPHDSMGMRHAGSQVRRAALNARPARQKVRRAAIICRNASRKE
jgi:pyridoxine 5'-phosphate synthase PdxJ